jgi:hypothetical protein
MAPNALSPWSIIASEGLDQANKKWTLSLNSLGPRTVGQLWVHATCVCNETAMHRPIRKWPEQGLLMLTHGEDIAIRILEPSDLVT